MHGGDYKPSSPSWVHGPEILSVVLLSIIEGLFSIKQPVWLAAYVWLCESPLTAVLAVISHCHFLASSLRQISQLLNAHGTARHMFALI